MTYQSLFDEMRQVVDSYSLGTLLNGLDASLINILLTNHWSKIKLCTDYDTTVALANHAISAHVRMSLQINSFITDEKDRRKLYDLFQTWRQKLFMDVDAHNIIPLSQIEQERCV